MSRPSSHRSPVLCRELRGGIPPMGAPNSPGRQAAADGCALPPPAAGRPPARPSASDGPADKRVSGGSRALLLGGAERAQEVPGLT
jgi:hypothetical protein